MFLPLPLRIILRTISLAPRILNGILHASQGEVFHSEVLDAAAISMALITRDFKTAGNINFLLDIGETIEEFTKKKSYDDLADRLLNQNDQVQLITKDENKNTIEKTVPLHADIVLSCEDGLEGLYKVRILGTELMNKIDRNNANIIAVNTSLMFLGLFGIISPSLAAILHNASTIAFSVTAAKPLLK